MGSGPGLERVFPEWRRGEEGGELGVEGLGKVDPAQNLQSAVCSPCGSRLRLAAALYRLALRTAALRVLTGPRRESAETRARPGGSAGGPRR